MTGQGPGDPTWSYPQSEAVINVKTTGQRVLTVSFNDDTDDPNDPDFTYGTITRDVRHGASEMGWSYSLDEGQSFIYGGKVAPPPGQAILWSDPAIASWRLDQRYVFIANLAISEDKVPPGGTMHNDINSNAADFVDGACIARSTDGGIHFESYQCVTNQGHFFDGSSLAITTDAEVWFATVDMHDLQIDVWRASGVSALFVQVTSPFAGYAMATHPRLRSFGTRMYVLAQDIAGRLLISRRVGAEWSAPVMVTTSSVPLPPVLTLANDKKLRTGPQYAYDVATTAFEQGAHGVGDPCQGPSDCPRLVHCDEAIGQCMPHDQVRILYTKRANIGPDAQQGLELGGAACDLELAHCEVVSEWGTDEVGEDFNPVLVASPGLFDIKPVWQAAWLSRNDDPDGDTLTLEQGRLLVSGANTPLMLPTTLVGSHLVCGDRRGYWGDYNDIRLLRFNETASPDFITVKSDSSDGCVQQWLFTSQHLHIDAVVF